LSMPLVELPFLPESGIHLGFEELMSRRWCPTATRPDLAERDGVHASKAGTVGVSDIRVGVAQSSEHLEAAEDLVRKRYSWRGYDVGIPKDSKATASGPVSRQITFVAADDRYTLGTITLGLDGPSGLHADETHRDAVDAARAQGRRVCELTRFAVHEKADSRRVLASLFSLVYAAGRTIHGVTDVFIEVNPRHVSFYSRLLGFVVAAGERFCERVRAPSVLLHLELGTLEERLLQLGFGALAMPLMAEAA
jgi:hypothetical protein